MNAYKTAIKEIAKEKKISEKKILKALPWLTGMLGGEPLG